MFIKSHSSFQSNPIRGGDEADGGDGRVRYRDQEHRHSRQALETGYGAAVQTWGQTLAVM